MCACVCPLFASVICVCNVSCAYVLCVCLVRVQFYLPRVCWSVRWCVSRVCLSSCLFLFVRVMFVFVCVAFVLCVSRLFVLPLVPASVPYPRPLTPSPVMFRFSGNASPPLSLGNLVSLFTGSFVKDPLEGIRVTALWRGLGGERPLPHAPLELVGGPSAGGVAVDWNATVSWEVWQRDDVVGIV